MNIIGVTGNSGSGKTLAAQIIREKYNAEIIDADKIAKQLLENKTEYFNEVLNLFGNEILNDEGNINRKKLADIIFSNDIKREALNEITFIYVVNEIKSRVEKICNKNIVIDAPLLFESNLDKICAKIISILADEEIKLKRIMNRDNLTPENAKKRLNSQKKDEYYIEKSTFFVYNNKDVENLKKELEKILNN